MSGAKSILILAFVFAATELLAADPAPSAETRPEIFLATKTEEGKDVLVATVKLGGKPMEGARVAFFVKRSFGLLSLGEDETLEDGTAAVLFPKNLPGDATGKLNFVTQIVAPPRFASVRAEATFGGGVAFVAEENPFPRALWSPRAPLGLILTIVTLVGGVWCIYAYVVVQLFKIRKAAKS